MPSKMVIEIFLQTQASEMVDIMEKGLLAQVNINILWKCLNSESEIQYWRVDVEHLMPMNIG